MTFTAIRMAVGRVLLVVGILILLFIPYLLWGTGPDDGAEPEPPPPAVQGGPGAGRRDRGHHPGDPADWAGYTAESGAVYARSPLGSPVGTIDIPQIGLSMVVVEGTDETRLQQGPGHYVGTPLPGEAGNSAIAGHRTTYLHPFYNLNELNPGSPIIITTTQGKFQYDVVNSESVSPNDVSVVDATDAPELTLTTCTPRYSASQRLVVHADLVASTLAGSATPGSSTAKPGHTSTELHTEALGAPGRGAGPRPSLGLLVAAVIIAVWVGAKRTHRGVRALVLVGGLLVWLVVTFAFFQSVAPLLPASY